MMKVSVVIPNYNNSKFLKDCVESCASDESVYEIIVVDDCSTDDSLKVLEELKDKFDTLNTIELPDNLGVSAARNKGIRESLGDIIVLLDSDDMLTVDSVSKRMEVFNSNPDIDIVHGPVLKCHGDISYQMAVASKLSLHPSLITGQGVMIKASVFQEYGLYYEPLRSKEDKEMFYRLGMHAKSPLPKKIKDKRVGYPVAFYRRHEGAKRKRRSNDLYFDVRTCMEFDKRLKQLELHGITEDNTEFLR